MLREVRARPAEHVTALAINAVLSEGHPCTQEAHDSVTPWIPSDIPVSCRIPFAVIAANIKKVSIRTGRFWLQLDRDGEYSGSAEGCRFPSEAVHACSAAVSSPSIIEPWQASTASGCSSSRLSTSIWLEAWTRVEGRCMMDSWPLSSVGYGES